MTIIITTTAVLFLLFSWAMSAQRQLMVMDANVDHAITQIGFDLSLRFDTLECLLVLLGEYAEQEAAALMDTVKAHRIVITAKSSVADILKQQEMLLEAFRQISILAQKCPELMANETYVKCMAVAEHFQKMARTARLIYNDSAARLNRSLQRFPASFVARMLGIHKREYLEAAEDDSYSIPFHNLPYEAFENLKRRTYL